MEGWEPLGEPTSLTIGVLDGVHLGHRRLLAHLDETLTRTVLTFDPHPIEVLAPGTAPRLITTITERLALLAACGLDRVGILDLREIKDLTPDSFVSQVLVDRLDLAHLVVGADFRFGRDRAGNVTILEELGAHHGFEVEVIEFVMDDGAPVSSSRIRSLIESGRVADAAALLGSTFSVTNTVIAGDKRGRRLGYPTANLAPPERKLIPAMGVYACFALIGGDRHSAAVNVGVRPTFGGGELLIEAFILDFDDDIYGNELTIEFVQYLRPEIAFDGVEELVERMRVDTDQSRIILEEARSRI
jgi:riboflavin kinase/FMN adenylyltransferase